MDVILGLWRRLSAEELMLLNCGVGEDSWESLGLQGDPTILKEISPGCSLERMMLKLKLQYFGHLMRRVDSLEKTLMLGGIGGRRRWGQQRMRWMDGITNSLDMSLGKLQSWRWTGRPGVLRFIGSQRVWYNLATELNWTESENINYSNYLTEFLDNWSRQYILNTQWRLISSRLFFLLLLNEHIKMSEWAGIEWWSAFEWIEQML